MMKRETRRLTGSAEQGLPADPIAFGSHNPPDPRMVALARLLARRAARDWYRAQIQVGGKERP